MINFLKYRYVCFLFSLSIFCAFGIIAFYKLQTQGSVFNYSVEFTGGTQILAKFEKPVKALAVKGILEEQGWRGVVIREFSDNEILIRVKEFSNDVKGLSERIEQVIGAKIPDNRLNVLQQESIGSGIGKGLWTKSMYAILLGLIAMLAYIAIRFWSFAFAIGAVVALFHDALAILAVFAFLNREISVSVIAAILAILGYSVNDTIVIFSKIRENLKTMRYSSLSELVNVSINQTLRRTMLTSLSTALTVLAMFIIGGEALRDLSLALLIGIIFGTYSSIYIASPVMMLLYRD